MDMLAGSTDFFERPPVVRVACGFCLQPIVGFTVRRTSRRSTSDCYDVVGLSGRSVDLPIASLTVARPSTCKTPNDQTMSRRRSARERAGAGSTVA